MTFLYFCPINVNGSGITYMYNKYILPEKAKIHPLFSVFAIS